MTQNPNTVLAAVLAWLQNLVAGALLLISVPDIDSLDDIGLITWLILIAGSTATFLQHLYAIATRHAMIRVTGRPLGESKYYPQPKDQPDELHP